MIKKTLYFGNPAYLSLRNAQLVIKLPEMEKCSSLPEAMKRQSEITKPIEDIGVVVLDNKQITITSGAIEALLENNCALITCDSKSMPLKKQLWQQTIQAKINNQAASLALCINEDIKCMRIWANDVRSGDPDNLEARAAAFYWKTLFHDIENFTRDRDGIPPNNLLNYGYAILRAVIARSLVTSGLLPTLGIHHHNRYNAYCLADDIMEPYRPFIDRLVYQLYSENKMELTKEVKASLLSIPTIDVRISGKRSPLMIAASQTTASLYKCFSGESRKIIYPEF